MGRSGAQYAQLGAANIFTQLNQFLAGANLHGMRVTHTAKVAGYTALSSDVVVLVDATAGPVLIQLPFATSGSSVWAVKKTDASANAVTVQGVTGLIDGVASFALPAQSNGVMIQSDGTNGFAISKI